MHLLGKLTRIWGLWLDEMLQAVVVFNVLPVRCSMIPRYLKVLEARRALVESDAGVVSRIDSDLARYQEDMLRDFGLQKAQVENVNDPAEFQTLPFSSMVYVCNCQV
eukprot:COSAG02_NODE_3469_length_6691_cov_9.305218_3_plen_107_part_00